METVPDAPSDQTTPPPPQPDPSPTPPAKSKAVKSTEDDGADAYRPGQRHPEPSLDDPSRAFYESLYQQNPKSEMGLKYCIEYGLVPESQAEELCQVLAKLKRDAKKKKGV